MDCKDRLIHVIFKPNLWVQQPKKIFQKISDLATLLYAPFSWKLRLYSSFLQPLFSVNYAPKRCVILEVHQTVSELWFLPPFL